MILKKNNWFSICASKNRYEDLKEVFRVGNIEMKIRTNQKQLYTYRCPDCDYYHLTHNSNIIDVEKLKIE